MLALNLNAAWHWFAKSAVNLLVAGFFFITYHSWAGILGWPTEHDLPQRFYLHAVSIDEPHRIYLWGTDLDRGLGRTVPRAFSVPYSPKLHDKVDKASRKLRKNLPVIAQVGTPTSGANEITSLDQAQTADVNIDFVDAPQNLVPGKN
ncbi:MAG: hypothetical protein V3U76_11415 [Granulosicoccus sp.]